MTRDELQLLTIAELAKLWRVSERTVWRCIKDGEIPVVRVAESPRVRLVDAARYLDGLPSEQAT